MMSAGWVVLEDLYTTTTQQLSHWRFGVVVNALVSINEVNLHQARLVLGWVTVSGMGKSISVHSQSPRSTQPGHPSVGRRNEYQPKGGDALWLGSIKAGMVREWVAGKTVWSSCYHGPYLSVSSNGFVPYNRALYKCPISLTTLTLPVRPLYAYNDAKTDDTVCVMTSVVNKHLSPKSKYLTLKSKHKSKY